MSAVEFELQQKEFNKAIQEVLDVEPIAASEVITRTAKHVINRIVYKTPQLTNFQKLARRIVKSVYGKASQRAIAALKQGRGHPKAVSWYQWAQQTQSMTKMGWAPSWRGVGRPGLPRVKKPGQVQEGSFLDARHKIAHPYVALTNHVSFVEKIDSRRNIIGTALQENTVKMDEWLNRRYAAMMKKRSGR